MTDRPRRNTIRWITRDGTTAGWLCIGCGTEHPGADRTASEAANQHDCKKVQILRELSAACTVIEIADAVRTEDDGFRWVDTTKLPADFVEYYTNLKSAAYALGAI